MFIAATLSFLAFPNFTYAKVIFTEIMFDVPGTDTGREWIEVTNTSDTSENLEDYRLFEANTNHVLTFISGNKSLSKNASAIIVSDPNKFKADWPNFSGTIFDSSFSLSNTGETLIIRNKDLEDIDSLTYAADKGALGDGNTLSLSSSGFVSLPASPGVYSEDAIESPNVDENSPTSTTTTPTATSDVSSVSTSEPVSFVKELVDIKLSTPRDRVALVGMPISIETQALDSKNSSKYVEGVSYDWSMGDGEAQSGRKISYSYLEPGEYVIVVKAKFKESLAVTRSKISVLPFSIIISEVLGGEYIELENKLGTEANIGGAFISNDNAAFRIPEDTIILPKKKIRIPQQVLGIDLSGDKIYLKDASGKEVYVFEKELPGEVLGASTSAPEVLQTYTSKSVELKNPKLPKPKLKIHPKKVAIAKTLMVEEGASTKHMAFKPIEVISKPKEGMFKSALRFLGNLF